MGGTIATPGTANVYVNGGLIRSVQLQPGSFNLSQIPVTAGNNAVAVVVRGDDGRTQTFGQSYFAVNSLLVKGMTDYDYSVGLVRRSGSAAAYGMPALAATYRLGASAGAMFGGTLEATGMAQVARWKVTYVCRRGPSSSVPPQAPCARATAPRSMHCSRWEAIRRRSARRCSIADRRSRRSVQASRLDFSRRASVRTSHSTIRFARTPRSRSTLRTIRTATARRAKRRTAPPFPFR